LVAGSVRQLLTNFTKGELGPELYGRIDSPHYQAGAKRVRNFIIEKFGGLSFRPGFRFVAEADDVDTPLRYLPFQYNIEQAYVIVLGEANMRLLALGGIVLEDNLEIDALTLAADGKLTVPYHDYSVGDLVYLSGITGTTQLNGRFTRVASVIDADEFTVEISTLGMTTFVSSDGITRSGAPTPTPTPPAPTPVPPPPDPPTTGGGSGGGFGEYYGGGVPPALP
jgi:hypothetical protein